MSDQKRIGLDGLTPPPGSKSAGKRAGRGPGSGRGKTAGRGHKGQKSRSGGSLPAWFEGGQMPLYRRMPKRGFTPLSRLRYRIVNLRDIAGLDDAEVTPEVLRERGLIGAGSDPVKVLALGEIDRAVTVRAHAFSATARSKIEAAGGSAELIG